MNPVRLIPVPAGPIQQIYADWPTYAAFPVAHRCADGTALLIYRGGRPVSTGHLAGAGHACTTPNAQLIRQPPGAQWWSKPSLLIPAGPVVGFGGLTGECATYGGRVLAAVRVNGQAGSVFSDDSGLTWSGFVPVPSLVGGEIPGGTCSREGLFYLATQGVTSSSNPTPVVRVYSGDGVTWTQLSTVSIPGRWAQEPVIVTLADGRLGLLIRSDDDPAGSVGYDYIYSSTSDDGINWSPMTNSGAYLGLQIAHGSGQPNTHVLPSGDVIVVHRGKTEPLTRVGTATKPPVWGQPVAVSLLDPALQKIVNTEGKAAYQFMDLVDGDMRWMTYGTWLPGWQGSKDRLIYSVHNGPVLPDWANDDATATLYQREMDWVSVG